MKTYAVRLNANEMETLLHALNEFCSFRNAKAPEDHADPKRLAALNLRDRMERVPPEQG